MISKGEALIEEGTRKTQEGMTLIQRAKQLLGLSDKGGQGDA
tara:strand:- start:193 stop:318 length:126 start_codon:yes stop_codon:yes gene_type:complete